MKSNRKPKSLILILLGLLFALSPIINNSLNFNGENNDSSNLDNEDLKISAVSGRIHIDNNWTYTAGNYTWCTGSGTYPDPYIIQDLVIDGGGSGSCIWIENSTVYFRIENCTLQHGYRGMELRSVNNGQLIDNDCLYNDRGIYLIDSNNNTISGNTANNNDAEGIDLLSSNNNTISGNSANNNEWDGINLEYSSNNTISGNTANNNGLYGILLFWSSDNNTISGNTLIGNRRCYSESSDCEGNVFENNDCENKIDLTILYLIIPLTILYIAIPLTMAGMIMYERRKHSTFPKYGTISLIFDLLGLLTLSILVMAVFGGDFRSLIATPFTIVGIICGYLGYKGKRDTTRVLEVLGTLLGIGLFGVSIYPVLGLLVMMGFGM